MRRRTASRTGVYRLASRRRRAIAPAAAAQRRPLRARISTPALAAAATVLARRIGNPMGRAVGMLVTTPVRAAGRRAGRAVRATRMVLRVRLFAGGAWVRLVFSAGAGSVRTAVSTAFAHARNEIVRGIDLVRRRGHWTLRWIRGVRLPDIPGGDPVVFGAGVGMAIIVGAAVIVLARDELHHRRAADELSPVATLSERDAIDIPEARLPADATKLEIARSRDDAEISSSSSGPKDEDVSMLSVGKEAPESLPANTGRNQADEVENLVAALPLLDLDDDQRRRSARRPPGRQPLAIPPRLEDLQPPTPTVRPQWLANAVPIQHRPGRHPMIAIVIDDAGVAQARTARAIALPPPLTIAFIPYSRNLAQQTHQARDNGHELLLHIPMEPGSNAVDPGPNALLTSLDGDENMRRLRWALGRFDGYVGVNNHMGSKFMARADLLEPLLAEMNARGLLFLDSRTDKSTVGAELAQSLNLPHASRQVFLDNELDADKILRQLARLERVARRHGHAIAIGHPHDITVDVLAKWIPEARARGFDLVPVSAIVKLAYGGDRQLAAAAGGGEPDRLLGSAE